MEFVSETRLFVLLRGRRRVHFCIWLYYLLVNVGNPDSRERGFIYIYLYILVYVVGETIDFFFTILFDIKSYPCRRNKISTIR